MISEISLVIGGTGLVAAVIVAAAIGEGVRRITDAMYDRRRAQEEFGKQLLVLAQHINASIYNSTKTDRRVIGDGWWDKTFLQDGDDAPPA